MHKTSNVLNYLPKSSQAKAKQALHEIWMAETREKAEKAFDSFLETYEAKYPKVAHCLLKDRVFCEWKADGSGDRPGTQCADGASRKAGSPSPVTTVTP